MGKAPETDWLELLRQRIREVTEETELVRAETKRLKAECAELRSRLDYLKEQRRKKTAAATRPFAFDFTEYIIDVTGGPTYHFSTCEAAKEFIAQIRDTGVDFRAYANVLADRDT